MLAHPSAGHGALGRGILREASFRSTPMNVKIPCLTLAAAVVLLGVAGSATAQTSTTRIVLTTANGDCVATTSDPQGVHLATGSTDLVASGVTLSGTACGGNVVPAPTSLVLSAQSPSLVNTAVVVSWTTQGGAPTSCTGTVTKDGASLATLAGWTDVSTTVSPRTITPTATGTYVLTLTCGNSAGSTSGSKTVQVNTVPSGDCPATILSDPSNQASQPLTRLMTSNISYGIYPSARPNMDVTSWDNIWGHGSTTDAGLAWPGPGSASPVIRDFGRTTYLAAKFHVPAGYATTHFGQYAHAINPPGPPVSASISRTCGDFAPALGVGCLVTAWPDDLSTHLQWKVQTTNTSFCSLLPDTDYYLNMKLTDPTSTEACDLGATSCIVYLQHTHN